MHPATPVTYPVPTSPNSPVSPTAVLPRLPESLEQDPLESIPDEVVVQEKQKYSGELYEYTKNQWEGQRVAMERRSSETSTTGSIVSSSSQSESPLFDEKK